VELSIVAMGASVFSDSASVIQVKSPVDRTGVSVALRDRAPTHAVSARSTVAAAFTTIEAADWVNAALTFATGGSTVLGVYTRAVIAVLVAADEAVATAGFYSRAIAPTPIAISGVAVVARFDTADDAITTSYRVATDTGVRAALLAISAADSVAFDGLAGFFIGVRVSVGVPIRVAIRVAVNVCVAVDIRVAVRVTITVGVCITVSIAIRVTVPIRVAIRVAVNVCVAVAIRVAVRVTITVGVCITVSIAIRVTVTIAVSIDIRVSVRRITPTASLVTHS
jgi:hypothetical protein